ncbi:MAG: amidohydrolase family protein [Proteobacteria bacterium]|nr:amidohydrolase family protein [Pseudomonadota bacterium]
MIHISRSLALLAALLLTLPAAAETYDIVIRGGRVMDPETGTDAPLNVGISGDRITRITAEPLTGSRVIDAAGLVVAPGFIDLHQHGQDEASGRVKALDGVTTALEMEIGVPDVPAFLREKSGHSLIHFGSTASHPAARARAFGVALPPGQPVAPSGPATNDPATPAQLASIEARLSEEIGAGALGVGMGIQYTPGATRSEVIRVFRLAAAYRMPVFTHVRSFGRLEPGSSIEAVSEVIGAAAVTGASLQIVHVNSSCIADALECLDLIAGARARGLDVTTEAYPYLAGMTAINSALFNPGWREKLGIDYDSLQLPNTGERLTKERFEALHASPEPQEVLIFVNKQALVDQVIAHPLVSIASDGGPGHPRNAGTYARVLAHSVREQGAITLMDALRKMSLMPAQRLARATAAAQRKGRLQVGADADIVVFDPARIVDHATYAAPMQPSTGMRYVLVAGTVLVDRGEIVAGRYPGRALVSDGSQRR